MRRILIPAIFALSGAAGLIFEVVWARQLVLVFGNTTQAVSAILTGFFGGMAIGAWFGGIIADRARRPLALYGVLELVLALIVLLTPHSFTLIHEAYRSAFSSLESSPTSLALVRFSLSLIALAPATILMGATLPTLTRYLARQASDLGAAFARLYAANTMGAVFGATAAGLVLIELFGLSGALLVGASCSATAGVIAVTLDLHSSNTAASNDERTGKAGGLASHPRISAVDSRQRGVALAFAFVSGLTSLSYQVLWMRLIASGTGSSTYVFTTILAIFLIGLALGAIEYKRVQGRVHDIVKALALTQIGIAILACLGMYGINALDSPNGVFLWKALAAVLPVTFLMGFSFPAASALLGGKDGEVATQSGRLLASNTLGAIIGASIVPFVLIPVFGSPAVLGLTALTNAITGALLAWRGGLISRRIISPMPGAGIAVATAILITILTGSLFVDPGVARLRKAGAVVSMTDEDEIASVQAGSVGGNKQLWVTGFSMTALTVDAKLMPLMPLMLRPRSETLLAIAFGMGSSYRSALIAGLRSDAVEIVPSVPGMFGVFYDDARRVAANPRGRIIIGDGRNYVELTQRRYDIIIVDPPPPLQASGVSIISSREFYQASRKRLNAGGVMMQWVPWGQSVLDVKNHVRTFKSVFPNVIIADGPGGNGFYMFGSIQPIAFTRENIEAILSRKDVVADISSAYDSPEADLHEWTSIVLRLVRLEGDAVQAFAGDGPLVTDDRPLPEYFLLRMKRDAAAPLDAQHVWLAKSP